MLKGDTMPTFETFCETFFQKYFTLHPTEAIHYGIAGYDHLLTDYNDEATLKKKHFRRTPSRDSVR